MATDSSEVVRALAEAEVLAGRSGQPLSSGHLLSAFFLFPNRARVLMLERGIDEMAINLALDSFEDEPPRTLIKLRDRARALASGAEGAEVDCLHILIAMTRARESFACKILQHTGVSVSALRNVAVSYVTGNMPRRYRTLPRADRSFQMPDQPAQQPARRTTTPVRTEMPMAHPMPPPAAPQVTTQPFQRTLHDERPHLEEVAPTLATCGTDLTERARLGLVDMVIGRERELESLIDILGKRRANNPMLVGPPGVGKTAIVEGLAVKIAREDPDVEHLRDCMVVALDTGALVAGTSLRGAFSERLGSIKSEVAGANRSIIVFIDEMHTLIGAGSSGEGPQDAANELKTALARGEFPCIGATTAEEFKKYIERDAALERRFSPITVEEPSPEACVQIVAGAIHAYAEHHSLDFSLEAIEAAVNLSHRFISERRLPDKAFAVIDLAGSRARRRRAKRVERIDVARVIHEWSNVPIERLSQSDAERFAHAEEKLSEKLIGHTPVIASVARAIRRGYAGLNQGRPMSSLLFLGPPGVGKTELVKILAEYLFGRRDAIVRLDMSELSEKHAVARLIGAQPGYIGYEEGGQLTEALRRRPFQIVLFDEVEKAHGDVLNLLLQILDEGHLTDSRGRRVSFTNTLVILTSNLGSERLLSGRSGIGFGSNNASDTRGSELIENAKNHLSAELWSRLDEKLVFLPLNRSEARKVAGLQLQQTAHMLESERHVGLSWDEAVLDYLLDAGGFVPDSGARGMRQAITRLVEGPLAEQLLAGKIRVGGAVHLGVEGGEQLTFTARRRTAAAARMAATKAPPPDASRNRGAN